MNRYIDTGVILSLYAPIETIDQIKQVDESEFGVDCYVSATKEEFINPSTGLTVYKEELIRIQVSTEEYCIEKVKRKPREPILTGLGIYKIRKKQIFER